MHQQTSPRCRRLSTAVALLLAAVALLALPATGRAQWTPPDASGNTNYPNGKVGVGTASPATALEVGRNAGGAPTGVTITGGVAAGAAPVLYFNYADAAAGLKRWGVWGDIGGAFNIGTQPDALGAMSPKLSITNGGSVGIGTTDPWFGGAVGSKLTVVSPVTAIAAAYSANQLAFAINPQSNGSWIMYDHAASGGAAWTAGITQQSGNVGIGTASPPQRLTVDNTVDSGAAANVRLRSATTRYRSDLVMAGAGGLGINAYDDLDGAYLPARIDASKTVLGMQGSVGVGTSSPDAAYKLDVAGSAKVSSGLSVGGAITGGSFQATYQDVAEWVPSTQKLAAGTVVVLDPDRANQVISSTEAYDTRVAGVVSERPGIALGEGGEGKVLVATTGRVRVKVDATKAPVRIGDLLVTGETPGVAMRSEPVVLGGRKMHAPGTIIGKALEPLAGGVGEILVLLSLQ